MKKWLIVLSGLWFVCTHAQSALIIDTFGKDRYHYRNMELLCQSVGFQTTYKNLYDLLEHPKIENVDTVFFICNPALLARPSDPIAQTCWLALRSFTKPHTNLAFLLPARPRYSKQMHQKIETILESLGIFKENKTIQTAHHYFIEHFLQPDTHHANLFGTSLLMPDNKTNRIKPAHEFIAKIHTIKNNHNEIVAQQVPHNTSHLSENARKTLPLGLLTHNTHTNSICLLSKLSLLSFCELDENFMKNPFDLAIRQELLASVQQTLFEFFHAIKHKKITPQIKHKKLNLPQELTLSHMRTIKHRARKTMHLHPHYDWTKKGIKCAWLDPYDFFHNNDESVLHNGIKMLYESEFNMLWFELLPSWYLSDHGRKKEQKNEYITRIKTLFAALKAYGIKHKKPIPQIFLGMNLTSNFNQHPVKHKTVNLFGHEYSKIPAPLDINHFWHPETLDIFDTFLHTFQNDVSVDGIFFDFEMYHAQKQASAFTDLMDFSDFAWKLYAQKNESAPETATHQQKVTFLTNNKLFNDYFNTLYYHAIKLGQTLKNHMRDKLPNALFAAYAPTLPNSWFYRGITRGLSSPQEPLLFASFNTDYFSHHEWLKKQNIYLLHGSALMLSKLQTKQDFKLIDTINHYHDFVWFNRPSRMVPPLTAEQRNKQWWGIESSPLPTDQFIEFMKKY